MNNGFLLLGQASALSALFVVLLIGELFLQLWLFSGEKQGWKSNITRTLSHLPMGKYKKLQTKKETFCFPEVSHETSTFFMVKILVKNIRFNLSNINSLAR